MYLKYVYHFIKKYPPTVLHFTAASCEHQVFIYSDDFIRMIYVYIFSNIYMCARYTCTRNFLLKKRAVNTK